MYQLKKFFRCCYYLMKELVEFHGSSEVRHVFYFDILFFVYSIFYYLAMAILGFAEYRVQILFAICTKDPVCLYIYHHQAQYDPFFSFAVFLMELFNIYCQAKLVFLNTDTLTWRWWHQLVVQHQDFYYRSKLISSSSKLAKAISDAKIKALESSTVIRLFKALTPQFIFERCVLSTYLRAKLFINLKTINRHFFYRQKLSNLPNLSPRLRRQLLLFQLSIDRMFFLFQALITFILLFIYFSFFHRIVGPFINRNLPFAIFLWTLTLAIVYYCLMRLTRSALFFVYCSLLGTIVYVGHLVEIGGRIRRLLAAYDFSHRLVVQLPITYRPLFTRFLHDHNLICRLVLTASRDLFGDVLFLFLLTNIPINIWLVRRMFILHQETEQLLVFWTVIITQSVALTIVFWPLASCQKVFHSPKKWINHFQLKGRSSVRWLRLKLKYDDLYHRLSTGPKMAISIGPINSITFETTLEFIFLYIGYLLMALRKNIDREKRK